ncbi:hypothetical protein CHN51_09675 [Sphingorhabdus sp. YGSMI21]|nr:hypothetical protein CHN51_09675 [Sphingorhabdus sp. YGSMI21]
MRILAPMILMLAPVSASAEPPPHAAEIDLTKLNDQNLLGLYNKSMAEKRADACKLAAILSELIRRNLTQGIETFRIEYRLQCSIDRKDWANAYQNIKVWEAHDGEKKPAPEWIFRLAFLAGENDEALDRLETITKLDDPEQLTLLPDEAMFSLTRRFNEDGRLDLVARQFQMLFESPHFALLSTDLRSLTAARMLEEHVKNGYVGDVGKMLPHIASPHHFTIMLADRSYEPIWPRIERFAGLNMTDVLHRYLLQKKSEVETRPDDKETMRSYVYALFFSGRFEDVIALAGPIDHINPANWDENDSWLVNLEAYALDALGDTDAADRIFDQFTQVDYQPEKNGWLVNFVINRALRLVGQKRWQEGLVAANVAAEIAQKSGSPYARMLVWQSETCALHGLGRTEEARAKLSQIVQHEGDAPVVAVQTLLCVGARDHAASLVIDNLRNDAKRGAMIEALQGPEFDLFYEHSELPHIHTELRNHPEVAPVFTKLARDIPKDYIPLLGVRKQKLLAERQAD